MNNFNATYLTHAGAAEEALAKQEGRKVQIAYMVIGLGKLPEGQDPRDQTALLIPHVQLAAYTHIGKVAGEFKVDADLPIPDESYNYWEIGTITDTGVLYTYTRALGDFVPGKDDLVSKVSRPRLYFKTQSSDIITLTEDKTQQYVVRPDFDDHIQAYNAFALATNDAINQRERKDNAASNADIDNESSAAKHVKLSQFWRGINKKITAAFANRTISTTGPLRGGGSLGSNRTFSVDSASTTAKGVSQLSSAINSVSETLAATPKAVKAAYDKAVEAINLANTKVAKSSISDSVTSTSQSSVASSRSAKTAHDKGVEALNKANSKWSYVQATLTAYGATKLSSAVNSVSETLAATPKAVKAAYDKAVEAINLANTKVAKSSISDSVTSTSQSSVASSRSAKTAHDKGVEALNKANSKWSYVQATLTAYGATKLSSVVNSTSEALAATPKAVKTAYDKAVSAYNLANSKWTHRSATTSQTGTTQLNASTSSTSTSQAATPSAVKSAMDKAKSAYDLAATKITQATADNLFPRKSAAFVRSQSSSTDPSNKTSQARRYNPNSDNPSNEYYAGITYGNERDVIGQLFTHYITGRSFVRAFNSVWSDWAQIYTTVHKPTKTDVGLGSVVNAGQTSSVSDSSTTKYATAKAAKTAYDKAVEALNKANNKWSYVQASVSAYGATKLSSAVNSVSESLAATPKAVKTAYDKAVSAYNLANGKWTHRSATTSQTGTTQLNTSTSSTSTSQAATPSAVKAAMDKAREALNAANNGGATTLTQVKTALLSNYINSGNFKLLQPYDVFDEIWVVSSDDSGNETNIRHITKEELRTLILYGTGSNGIDLIGTRNYWWGKFSADKRTFISRSDNGRLKQIYGVNNTWS